MLAVSRTICTVFALLMALSSPAFGGLIVLTFDELPDPGPYGTAIPDGYGGLNWPQMAYHRDSLGGYANGCVSPPHVAYNQHGLVASVGGDPFDFIGAYFAAAWNEGLHIRIEGLRAGEVAYDETIVVSYYQPEWHTLGFAGIDQLRFTSWGGTHAHPEPGGFGTHFVMDNFTIPEPLTLAFLAAGGLLVLRRSRVVPRT